MNKPQKTEAVAKITDLIHRIDELARLPHDSPEFAKWHRATELALRNIFGENAKNVDEFTSIRYVPMVITVGAGEAQYHRSHLRGLQSARALLESMVEEIREYWQDGSSALPPSTPAGSQNEIPSRNVFIIHGRDDGLKETIARLVSDLGYIPVILHEQPSGGKTVIEKFERHADACFAIALLTPDDMRSLRSDGIPAPSPPECYLRVWIFRRTAFAAAGMRYNQGRNRDAVGLRGSHLHPHGFCRSLAATAGPRNEGSRPLSRRQ